MQAEKLAGALTERGIPCAYTWCRYSPRLLDPLNKLAKRLIRRRKGGSEYSGFTSSKRGILSKPIIGWAWLNLSLLDYLIQVRSCFRGILESGKVLICDRFLYDMLADLAINFGRSGEGVAELAEKILAHREYLRTTDRLRVLEHERALAEIRAGLQAEFVEAPLIKAARAGVLDRLADTVAARKMTAGDAARAVEAEFLAGKK